MEKRMQFKKWLFHPSIQNEILDGLGMSVLVGTVVGLLYFPFFNVALLLGISFAFTMFMTTYLLDAIFNSFHEKKLSNHTHIPFL